MSAASFTAIDAKTNLGTSKVTCPAGTLAIGGGFEVNPTAGAEDRFERMHVVSMRPSEKGDAWVVVMHGKDVGAEYTFRAIATCGG